MHEKLAVAAGLLALASTKNGKTEPWPSTTDNEVSLKEQLNCFHKDNGIAEKEPGRNKTCTFCNSGKKYKKCQCWRDRNTNIWKCGPLGIGIVPVVPNAN